MVGAEGDERAGSGPREAEADDGAGGGQQDALGEELADQAPASRAHGGAHADLALAGGGAGEQQVGDVDARDQEHEAHGGGEGQHRRANAADGGLLHVGEGGSPSRSWSAGTAARRGQRSRSGRCAADAIVTPGRRRPMPER